MGASAHPHNVSLATAEWIGETRSFEVALKLSAEDLEEILCRDQPKFRVDDPSKATTKRIQSYVAAHFFVTHGKDKRIDTKWIGHEIEGADAWIYVELPFGEVNPSKCKLTNTLFVKDFENQINFVNFKNGKKRKSLRFTARRQSQRIRLGV